MRHLLLLLLLFIHTCSWGQDIFIPASYQEWKTVSQNPSLLNEPLFTGRKLVYLPRQQDEVSRTQLPPGTYVKMEGSTMGANLHYFENPPFQVHFFADGSSNILVLLDSKLNQISEAQVSSSDGPFRQRPNLPGYMMPPELSHDTLHIQYQGFHYRLFINKRYENYRTSYYSPFNSKSGYVVSNQPQYRIGDTLKVKAYLIRDRLTLKKTAYAKLSVPSRGQPQILGTYPVRAVSPGAFELKLHLSDSLKSNTRYQISFHENKKETRTSSNWACEFAIADYTLDEIDFELTPLHDLHRSGHPFSLLFSAKDALGLPAYGATLQLSAEFKQLTELYAPQVAVAPTLYSTRREVMDDTPILVEIPDSVFNKDADFEFTIKAEMAHPSGNSSTRTFSFEHKALPLPFRFEVLGNILHLYPLGGKETTVGITQVHHRTGKKTEFTLPYSLPIDRGLTDVKVSFGREEVSLKKFLVPAEVKLLYKEYPDSVEVKLVNPNQLSMQIHTGLKDDVQLSFSNSAQDTSFTMYRHKREDPFIRVDYFTRIGVRTISKIFYDMTGRLFIDHSIPKLINAGTVRADTVTITDFRGRPIKKANLTVMSLDNRFDQQYLLKWPPDLGSYYENDHIPFYQTPIKEHVWMDLLLIKGPYLKHLRATLPEVDFLIGLTRGYVPNPSHLTGIVPVLIKGHAYIPIYMVVDDSVMYNFAFMENLPVLMQPGIYKVGIRTEEGFYQFDSVQVKQGELTVLKASVHPGVSGGRRTASRLEPSKEELQLLFKNYQSLHFWSVEAYSIKGKDTTSLASHRIGSYWIRRIPQVDSFYFKRRYYGSDTVISAAFDLYQYAKDTFTGAFHTYEKYRESLRPNSPSNPYLHINWKNRHLLEHDYWGHYKKQAPAEVGQKKEARAAPNPWGGNFLPFSMIDDPEGTTHNFLMKPLARGPSDYFRLIAVAGDSIPLLEFRNSQPATWRTATNTPLEIFARSYGADPISYHFTTSETSGKIHFYDLSQDSLPLLSTDGFEERLQPQGRFKDWSLVISPLTITMYRKGWETPKGGKNIALKLTDATDENTPLKGVLHLLSKDGNVVVISALDSEGFTSVNHLKAYLYKAVVHTTEGRTIVLPDMDVASKPAIGKYYRVGANGQLTEGVLYRLDAPFEVTVTSPRPRIEPTRSSKTISVESITEMAVRDIGSVVARGPNGRPVNTLSLGEPANVLSLTEDAFETPDGWQLWSGRTRTAFRETALWKANLTTDKEGKAIFTNQWPGNLTTWSNHIFAAKAHRHAGYSHSYSRGIKPLGPQLYLPTFVVAGDSFEADVQVLNLTGKERSYTLSVNQDDRQLFTKNDVVHRTAHHRASFVVGKDTARFSALLETPKGYTDGEKKALVPLPKGIYRREGATLTLETENPQWIVAGEFAERVELSAPSPNFALPERYYLAGYAHGCNEQMSSRLRMLLANKVNGGPALIANPNNEIKKLIKLLEDNQNPEGYWDWWGNSATNMVITDIVSGLLLLADNLGFESKALSRLKITNGQTLVPTLFHLKLALVTGKPAEFHKMLANFKCQDAACLIELALLKQKAGAAIDIDTLLGFASATHTGALQWKVGHGNFRSTFYHTMQMATLLGKSGQHEPEYALALKGFLEIRGAGFYVNTYHAALFIEFMSDFNRRGRANVLTTHNNNPQTYDLRGEPTVVVLQPGDSLRILKKGQAPVFVYHYHEYFDTTLAQKPNGLFGLKADWLDANRPTKVLTFQKEAELRVSFTTDELLTHMMLEVPLPAGCRFNKESFTSNGHTYTDVEFFRDRCVVYYDRLRPGTRELSFSISPNFKGRFTQNPIRLRSMYDGQVDDFTGMQKIEITSAP